jgi:CDP-diacylglycerol---serine O-phosphatidyltransferase
MLKLFSLPNILTLMNLACGLIAIHLIIYQGEYVYAAYFVFIAGIFDFLDGFAARMLNISSDIGKQLDSLADMVTFGAVPGFMMYHLLLDNFGQESYIPFVAFAIPLFSALRLAKFNVDERETDGFFWISYSCQYPFLGFYSFSCDRF